MKTFTHRPFWLVFFALIAAAWPAAAQVSLLPFAQTLGSVALFEDGTLVAQATGTAPGPATVDDDNFPNQPLPFPFQFNGQTYTSFNINSNGYLTFGQVLPNPGVPYTPISQTGGFAGAIAAYGTDLIGRFSFRADRAEGSAVLTNVTSFAQIRVGAIVTGAGIPLGTTIVAVNEAAGQLTLSENATATATAATFATPSGSIRTKTIGTAPARVHLVQYRGFARFGGAATGESVSFQIQLSETTHQISIVYDSVFTTSPIGTALVQVGLRGATNADFNNRASTTSWLNSQPGAANSATLTMNATVFPPVGLTYTWTVPPCPPVASVTLTNLTGTTASFAWSAPATAPAAGYAFAIATESGLPTQAGTTTPGLTATVSALLPGTDYFFFVRSRCSDSTFSPWSVPLPFTTPVPCQPGAGGLVETFASAPSLPLGYSVTPLAGTGNWIVTTSPIPYQALPGAPILAPQFGGAVAVFNSFNFAAGTESRLTTACITLPTDTIYRLTFDHAQDGQFPTLPDSLFVEIATDGDSTFQLIERVGRHQPALAPTAPPVWTTTELSLAAFAGQSVRIGFRARSAFGEQIALDRIALTPTDTDDAEAVRILPPPACDVGASTPVRLVVRNRGTAPVASLPATYTVNGQPAVAETFSFVPPLGFGAGDTIAFATPANLSGTGPFLVTVALALPGDAQPANDTTRISLDGAPLATLPYVQTFGSAPEPPAGVRIEQVSGTGNWTFEAGGVPYPNLPETPFLPALSDSGFAFFNSYDFNINTESRLVLPCTVLPTDSVPTLTFRYARDGQFPNRDSIIVEVAAGAADLFERVGAVARFREGASVPVWDTATFALADFAGQTVQIGLRAVADFGNNMALDILHIGQTLVTRLRTAIPVVVMVYPNPATARVRLSVPARAVEVFDALGRRVAAPLLNPQEVDVRHLPASSYWLRIRTDEGVTMRALRIAR